MADSIEEVVYQYLTADTSFMSNFTGVYWQESDTKTEPYINFWLVTDSGTQVRLGIEQQGDALIQFDLWDNNKFRGARLRTVLAEKVKALMGVVDDYHVMTTSITEQNILRSSGTDLYHFVVDGNIRWVKEG
jgi:hypothetical protein